jgi:hypothetical protein
LIPQLSRSTACFAVLTLTAFALAVRLAGVDFYLPHGSLGDEAVYSSFFLRDPAHPPLDPAISDYYPQLVPRIALLFWHESHTAIHTLEEHLARASEGVLLARRVVAFISVLIVPATYLIARRFLGRMASVLAAGLASASFLDLWLSQQARPHAAFAALAALTLLGALEVRRRGDLRAWLCAGLACALSISILQTGILLLCPILVAHWLNRPYRDKRAHLLPLVAVALIAVSARAFYPSLFEKGGVSHGSSPAWTPYVRWWSTHLSGMGIVRSARALWEYEPWLSACALLGAIALCWNLFARRAIGSPRRELAISTQRIGDLAVVAAFALPMMVLFGLYDLTQQRYLLPFVPLLACCAAGGLEITCARIAERRGRSTARPFVLTAATMFTLEALCAVALTRVRAADDTARQAAAWLTAHVERGATPIMVRVGLELPLLRDEHSAESLTSFSGHTNNAWLVYQTHLDPSVRASLGWPLEPLPQSSGEDLALLRDPDRYIDELSAEFVVFALPDARPLPLHVRPALRRRGELVARFSPWLFPAADERPFLRNEWDDPEVVSGNWVWHALRARCLGPVIEIYRLHDRAR